MNKKILYWQEEAAKWYHLARSLYAEGLFFSAAAAQLRGQEISRKVRRAMGIEP